MNVKLICILVPLLGVSAVDDIPRLPPNLGNNDATTPTGQTCGLGKRCVPENRCSNLIDVRFDFIETNECLLREICCPENDIITEPIIVKPKISNTCGYRNVDGVGLRSNKTSNGAKFGEFPWMLVIWRLSKDMDEEKYIYRCGGSLIHPQVALTGADCVHNIPSSKLKVRAGEWDTRSETELYPYHERLVVDKVIHGNFNSHDLQNNMALLFLETPFKLAPNINTLCLPLLGYNSDSLQCYASGWGKDRFGNGRYQNILKKIKLSVVPGYKCQDYLRETRLGDDFMLHWSFLCAGGERGKDTCKGDGGSPLVCPIENKPNRFYQAGIVAWGIGCGNAKVPGVYTNVAQFRPWIDDQFKYRQIDTSYYNA